MDQIVRIIHVRYLDKDRNRYIGGVESYIRGLCELSIENGYKVIVYQYAEEFFKAQIDGYCVVGVPGNKQPHTLIEYIEKNDNPDYEKDILIFATETSIVKNKYKRSLAIQHGIAWDITRDESVPDLINYVYMLKGALRAFRKYQRYKQCNNLVCVDYNFVNWYRTQVAHIDMNIFVVPNFAKEYTLPEKTNTSTCLSIVFSRRLEDYRGNKLFAHALIKVISIHPDVSFTIAGDGPDEQWLHQKLDGLSNVTFTKFKTEDSIDFHSQFDIAVVPTKGSEGTSLSLLEAMSAGCAVIGTNVGGITNILINEYNGLIINPDVDSLTSAMIELIEDKEKRLKLAKRGQETVMEAFSFERWKKDWKRVLTQVCDK